MDLLDIVFEKERWEKGIDTGYGKKIDKQTLRKLTSVPARLYLYNMILNGMYSILPPHQAEIPKDTPGEFRTVYINEDLDRILLSIINDTLFEKFPELIHKQCKSYQKGLSCGKAVIEANRFIKKSENNVFGLKADLSKYFDSVPLEFIDEILDKLGKNQIVDLLRKFYHEDLCFDLDGNLIHKYQSLRQGAATASFLADAVLYDIDEYFTKHADYYVRYSDDILIIDKDINKQYKTLAELLAVKGLTLNPKKVEFLNKNTAFKFLGFSLRGSEISISKSRLKKFQKAIEDLTWRKKGNSYERAIHKVNNFLYKGNGEFSWATSILPTVNCITDIHTIDSFVMDCLRAVKSGNHKIGGLGYEPGKKVGVVTRGTGRNVTSNRQKMPKVEGYRTLANMKKVISYSRSVYDALVRQM